MREAGSKWMRMRHSLHCGSQTMQLPTVPSVIPSFGLLTENIIAGIIELNFAVIESLGMGPGKHGTSWNFVVTFSKTRKFWKHV